MADDWKEAKRPVPAGKRERPLPVRSADLAPGVCDDENAPIPAARVEAVHHGRSENMASSSLSGF
jgi:hypothetical protein